MWRPPSIEDRTTMKNQKLMPWNRKLTILSTTIALIALMCAALITVPLYAQEVTTLVSNTSETSTGSSNGAHAQSFQTGTSYSGYTVTEVQIRLASRISGSIQTVAKISANNGNVPGNAVATLTNPTSLLGDSLNTFTAPAGTTLEPSTTYWVVVNDGLPGGDTWQYALTPGNGQTGETGWEIADQRLFRTSGTNWTQSTNSLSIAIKGTINAPPPSQEALTPNQVVYIPLDWSLKPAGIGPGERFRLIFLSSTKRNATSSDIETYNTFVQNQAAAGHANIQDHASRFKVVGCTEDIDARDNTGTNTNGPGVPIYWVGGNKVADSYTDFYDGSWDDEANDRNQLGNDAHDTSQIPNYPWTGCLHDGTEAITTESRGLGTNNVRLGRPNGISTEQGPLGSALNRNRAETRPFYARSPVFQVPSMNANRLSPTGAPHPGKITSNTDNGIEHSVKLLKKGQYRIDVKGSEPSQPGGTIDNPRVKIFAGSSKFKLLNKSSNGVSQTSSETRATGGGIGQNSRLDIKAKQTDNYRLLVHRAEGDNGTYTITVTNLSWPDGRRAPDITVDQENPNNVEISWTKSKKTDRSLVAPPGNYKIEYRTLSGGSWNNAGTVDESARDATITSLARTTAYEVRVRMIPPADSTHIYRWGYARVHTTN